VFEVRWVDPPPGYVERRAKRGGLPAACSETKGLQLDAME